MRNIMRTRRATAIALALLVVALIGLVLPLRPSHRPPVLKPLNIEPAGIFDDAGQMRLITLSISNPDNPPGPVNTLHIRDATNSIQAKLSNQWHAVEGSLNCALRSGDKHECLILVPYDTTSLHLSLQ